ncbi:MAG: NADH-quinone oxidoreductase subunit A [Elusimicrobia bacterium]|nr:NADH-quinone oxidoreductase subunit A [Elusimicrobiota bacterium]
MFETSDLFLRQYGQVGIFLLFGIFFAVISLALAWLVRVRNHDPLLNTTYECGPDPVGTAWIPLNVRFYLFALLFVIFDVETLFIYPWAVIYKDLGMAGFLEMSVFIAILSLGLLYAWKKGALQWD